MEPKGSLPHSQELVRILSQIIPRHPFHLLKIHFNIVYSHLPLGLPGCLFHSGYPTKTPYAQLLSPIGATCHAHLILLGFITRIIFGDE